MARITHQITISVMVDTNDSHYSRADEFAMYVGPGYWGMDRVTGGGIKLPHKTALAILDRLPESYLQDLKGVNYRD